MTHRLVGLFCVIALAACSSHSTEEEEAVLVQDAVQEEESVSAGWCPKCNFNVYSGHRCGLTAPCQLCKREAGARHLHEVVWNCERDEVVMAVQHECTDAKTCTTCREDKRSLLASRGCERCHRQLAPLKVQGITSYCGACNLEVGANHAHGKTIYCRACLREAGKNHKCDATSYCPLHEEEHAPDHAHGITSYCGKCHREAGEEHKHGMTEWCRLCGNEQEWPHSHHN